MRRLRQWISDRLRSVVAGRYGLDGLSAMYLCTGGALVGCAIYMESATSKMLAWIAAAALGGYALYRCLSRDTEKQRRQWESFELALEELDYKISLRTEVWRIKRSYRYIRCKSCGHRFRVARKRENHMIRCPNCDQTILRRTKHKR